MSISFVLWWGGTSCCFTSSWGYRLSVMTENVVLCYEQGLLCSGSLIPLPAWSRATCSEPPKRLGQIVLCTPPLGGGLTKQVHYHHHKSSASIHTICYCYYVNRIANYLGASIRPVTCVNNFNIATRETKWWFSDLTITSSWNTY